MDIRFYLWKAVAKVARYWSAFGYNLFRRAEHFSYLSSKKASKYKA